MGPHFPGPRTGDLRWDANPGQAQILPSQGHEYNAHSSSAPHSHEALHRTQGSERQEARGGTCACGQARRLAQTRGGPSRPAAEVRRCGSGTLRKGGNDRGVFATRVLLQQQQQSR